MNLANKVKSAVRWAAALTMLMQLLMWAVTLIVIRLLTPEDYGLMAMGMIFVSFAMLVNEAGLGAALVQKAKATEDEVRSVHAFVIALNFAIYLIVFAAAPLIAGFFDEPMLVAMIRVIALLFPILAFEVAPLALLERNLEFKKKAGIYLAANVSGGLISLIFALTGAGVWSLIYGNLWGAIVKAIAISIAAGGFIRPVISISTIRPYLGFGGLVAAERIVWYIYRQADVLLIGKLLGKEALGYYYVALSLASLVYAKTGGLIYEVSLPTFSGAQEDTSSVGRYLVRALRVVGFVVFPLMFGLAAVSSEAVGLFLSIKWLDAAPLVVILSLSMPARILSNLFPPALQGIGLPRVSLKNIVLTVAIMVPAFSAGALFDTKSVALAWLVVFPFVVLIVVARSKSFLGIRWSDVVAAIAPPAIASTIMFFAVSQLGTYLVSLNVELLPRLALMVGAGVLVYTALSWLALRDQWTEFFSLARGR